MDINPPVRGMEELQPLLAYLFIYFIVLVLLRLFLWPALMAILRRRTLPRLLGLLATILLRLAAFGLLVLGFLWSLAVLGVDERFYDFLRDLGDIEIPYLGVIPIIVLILGIIIYFVIRPAFSRPSPPRRDS